MHIFIVNEKKYLAKFALKRVRKNIETLTQSASRDDKRKVMHVERLHKFSGKRIAQTHVWKSAADNKCTASENVFVLTGFRENFV